MELADRLRRWSLTREVPLPSGARVVGVGGLVRGGAGRTPLAIALAGALPDAVFVGHGYGGSIDRPHRVRVQDPVALVGDEALVAARSLTVPVFVGPRAETLAAAAREGRVVVVDRLLQTRPQRLACSIVVARTPPSAVVRGLVDLVVTPGSVDLEERVVVSRPLPSTLGLVTSMAAPERALASLRAIGGRPRVHVRRRDHARIAPSALRALDRAAAAHRLEAWVVDAKTFVLLEGRALSVPVVELRHTLVPAPRWLASVRAFVEDPG